jgi:hypothetical protein
MNMPLKFKHENADIKTKRVNITTHFLNTKLSAQFLFQKHVFKNRLNQFSNTGLFTKIVFTSSLILIFVYLSTALILT